MNFVSHEVEELGILLNPHRGKPVMNLATDSTTFLIRDFYFRR